MAEVIRKTIQEFGINPLTVSYFVLDNASNNNSAVLALAQTIGFNAIHRRLRCGPHTINLISQMLLWGKDSQAYDNDASEFPDEDKYISE
jgi:hypothetical protein